jgi:hypothetical protein
MRDTELCTSPPLCEKNVIHGLVPLHLTFPLTVMKVRPRRSHDVNLDSVVGIASRCGLDGPGIKSRWGRDFPLLTGHWAYPASYKMGTGSVYRG